MNKLRKGFALLLAMLLIFSVPETAFAVENSGQQEVQETQDEQNEGQTSVDQTEVPEVDPSFVSEIKLSRTTASLHIGESVALKATVLPVTAKNKKVTWSVSNEKIASVTSKGVVTAKNTGSCEVYCIAADGTKVYAVCKVKVKKRAYQRSKKYYQIQSEIELPSGGYSLSRKNIGLKVIKVNKKLVHSTSARYTAVTANAVRRFQRSHGLKATGTVNKKTWLAMGFSENSWYNLGTYRTPIKVNGASKKQAYINAMLNTAKEYARAGTKYRVGCSGKPGTYVDCSGLIFQCLYSVGINPEKNIVDHGLAIYEYTSRYLAADSKLGRRVSSRSMKKGDLIFYGSPVYHVSIYAGRGYIYDSWPGIGVTKRRFNRPISKVIRVF